MRRLFVFLSLAGLAVLQSAVPAHAQLTSELFIACHDQSKVIKVDTSTSMVTDPFIPAGSGGLSRAIGVSFGPDGNLYVTSTDTSQILRHNSTTGDFIDVFVDVNSGYVFDARFGPDGDLYVPDSTIVLRYDGTTGAPKPASGQSGAVFSLGGFSGSIRGLTFGPSGDPLVSTDGGVIYRLDKSSGAATVFATGPGFHGLTLGPDGNVYAACPFTSEVVRYDGTTGASMGAFVPSGGGGLNYGTDVTFGPDGDLYVASCFGQQILRYDGVTGDFKSVVANTATSGYGPVMLAFRPLEVVEVHIDIKPGSFPNSINPRSKGVIPVAILTTPTFDATTVDPLSVMFGPNGATEAHGRGHIEDADGDGDNDLVLHFRTQATGVQCGDTSASLTGQTGSGQAIAGADSIVTVGCN